MGQKVRGLTVLCRCSHFQTLKFALRGHSNPPLVRGTSMRKIKICIGICKGHHSKSTGHHGNAVGAVGYFQACTS